jgi:hypothetical protein
MLTNNKKSIFAKSIAMVMAVLMVLAVCLTGCADKTAQEAANNAQTTATEAKTAADAVKKALEDHLASLDPVTLEMVNQEIDKALVDYATTEALSDFVKKGELTDLSNKLADYIKKAELEAAVKALVLPYVKPADLTTEVNKLTELINAKATKEDITKALNEALTGNATDAELAAKAEELNGKITAVENKVNGLDLDGKITNALVGFATEEYVNEAIAGVTTRLEKLEGVVEAILKAFFTEEDIKTRAENINLLEMAPAEITAHIMSTWSEAEWNATTVEVMTLIKGSQDLLKGIYNNIEGIYTEENMGKINAALATAGLEPLFVKNNAGNWTKAAQGTYLKALEYALLRVPNRTVLAKYTKAIEDANDVPTFWDEYRALLTGNLFNIGHIETVGDPAKKYQVITIAAENELEAFNKAYDELLTKYVKEDAFNRINVNAAIRRTYGTLKAINVFDLGTKKIAYDGATYINGKDSAGNDIVLQPVSKTIRPAGDYVATAQLPSTNAMDWASAVTTKVVVDDKYGEEQINVVEYIADKEDMNAEDANVEGTYKALYEQLAACKALIEDANTEFEDFCNTTIKNNTVATLPALGAEGYFNAYLNALESYMCVEVAGYGPYNLYLEDTVKAKMEKAINRNTCADANHTAEAMEEIDELELYLAMRKKVYGELFKLYKSYAAEILSNMKFDYMSVSWYLISADFEANKPATQANTIYVGGSYITNDVAAGIANKTLSAGFIDAFLNGTDTFKAWQSVGTNPALKIEKSFKDTALVTYYGALNGTAMYADGTPVAADPVATIIADSAADSARSIRHHLNAATVNIGFALEELTVQDARDVDEDDASVVFVALLEQAVENLDEVYNRYLVEDYKKVQINKIYDKADELANLYSGAGDTALIEAIEHYLTGYSATKNTSVDKDADGNPKTTNKLFPEVTELVNGSLVAEMKKTQYVVADNYKAFTDLLDADLDKIEIETIGGDTMAAAKTAAEGFLANMEEMAIKDNYIVYLDTALTNLNNLYYNYFNISGLDYKVKMELYAGRNVYDQTISMNKYMELAGNIVFGTYRENYAHLLAIVATEDHDDHIKQLKTWDAYKDMVDVYANALKKVKSSDLTLKDDTASLNKIYRPTDWMTPSSTTPDYTYVGLAAVEFDKSVNVNAIYYTQAEDGSWTVPNELYK